MDPPPSAFDNVHHRSQHQDTIHDQSGYYNPVASQQFFDDTSGQDGYGGNINTPASTQPIPNAMFTDPLASMAMHYSSNLATSSKDYVDSNISKFIPVTSLKYYFAVDNSYVSRKLFLLLLPYAHADWSVKYANKSEPVAPRHEINAPDLYIPVMAFVTYIIVSGLILGIQDKFTPEHLGMIASSAFLWECLAICCILFVVYIMNVHSALKTLDLVAFFGYKYVGMIICMIVGMLTNSFGYYCCLGWTGLAVSFFLVRTLRLVISPESSHEIGHSGTKRRVYILIMIALLQPLLMYWLTYEFVP